MSAWLPQFGWRGGDRRIVVAPPVNPVPDAANMRAWMDSLDIDGSNNSTLTDGDAIASWLNKGTLGGSFAQGTIASRPTYRATTGLGGKAIGDFDGNDSLVSSLASSSWTFLHDGSGATIYSVVKTNTSAVHTIAATARLSTQIGIGHRYATNFAASYFMADGAVLQLNVMGANNSVSNNAYDVMCSTLSSSATPNANIYVNGTNVGSGNAAAFSALAPTFSLTIGVAPSTGFLVGQFAALLVYQGVHDATTRTAVLTFLQTRYGVTFPAP